MFVLWLYILLFRWNIIVIYILLRLPSQFPGKICRLKWSMSRQGLFLAWRKYTRFYLMLRSSKNHVSSWGLQVRQRENLVVEKHVTGVPPPLFSWVRGYTYSSKWVRVRGREWEPSARSHVPPTGCRRRCRRPCSRRPAVCSPPRNPESRPPALAPSGSRLLERRE